MKTFQTSAGIVQNLKDAGCDEQEIETFMADLEQEKVSDGIKLLRCHRRVLLENIHEWEKKMDCLDYLIYQMTGKQ